ncbi:ABC transporter ATP-binding protein [Phoenicibacter congonensis]|uniref:ABC transporter ATP-binding protein n=1 Tax=Phoenicibacter congonensis TaxID=1944646 RepID=UPI0009A65AB6|nr:ABC transporter ATP-binding protein [Phoenicibacter congonensis]
MSGIAIKDLSFSYGEADVLKNINLDIKEGEFHSLLGLSGCGKTTLLRLVAGFLTPSKGKILLDGRDITNLAPEKRNMGIVFQNYALFLHMSVAENVAYGLKVDKVPASEITKRVDEYLDLLNMSEFKNRNVRELSGGQQQRVALARALARGVDVLLLDEPMSNLDISLREKMRVELKNIQQQIGITTLLITHEQSEALSISDSVSVMNNGVIEQTGTPYEIYESPNTDFLRTFVGDMNVFDAGSQWSTFDHIDANGKVFIRPEHLVVSRDPSECAIEGIVKRVKYEGAIIQCFVEVGNQLVKVMMLNTKTACKFKPGDTAFVSEAK